MFNYQIKECKKIYKNKVNASVLNYKGWMFSNTNNTNDIGNVTYQA